MHINDFRGRRVHMIGIGGSSMSGLAAMLVDRGYGVTGSDRDDGYLLGDLRRQGIKITISHHADSVHGADLVVYTAAVAPDNPERTEAERLGIPLMERSTLLAQLMDDRPVRIAVCGTHGKTTTTSMLSQILVEGGLDPSVHIGGKLDAIGGSSRIGRGRTFVAEACEFQRSFLEMNPTVAVVLNIDRDHLDCYRDLDEIEQTFGIFMSKVPPDGVVIGNGDDMRCRRQMEALRQPKQYFGLDGGSDWTARAICEDEDGCVSFLLCCKFADPVRVKLEVPGRIQVYNALAAVAAAYVGGADIRSAVKTLERFHGAHRRFERTDIADGVEIYHDYGHNPAEMSTALEIAKKRCRGRLFAVMQPHTFSRVRALFEDYLVCTRIADITLVTDFCAAREKDPGDLNSGMLVEGMRRHGIAAEWTPSFDDTEKYLREHWQPGDLVLTMGCGDIYRLNDLIHSHQVERECK